MAQRDGAEPQRPGLGFAASVTAVLSSAVLTCMPMDALAVSGGGSISIPLSGEDLSGQDLRKYKLTKATLRQTNFSNANLEGVSLFACLAKRANFTGANLTHADLESGDFEEADLSNAVLEGAYVDAARFGGAKIDGSDWTDVILRKDQQQYLCSIASGVNPKTGVDTRESLMCP